MHKELLCIILFYSISVSVCKSTGTSKLSIIIDILRGIIDDDFRQPRSEDLQMFDEGSYDSEEKKCLAQRKFLANGQCHVLGTKGPCGQNEHFVLDRKFNEFDGRIGPICREKPCNGINEVWWPETAKCERKTWIKSEHCRERNKAVFINSYGEAVCECDGIFGEMGETRECHEYYQRGPCNANEVVTYNASTGETGCSLDRCFRQNEEISYTNESNGNGGRQANKKLYAPYAGVGECFLLGSPDPCLTVDNQSKFVVDKIWHLPKCSSTNILASLGPKNFCKVTNGKCREEFEIASDDVGAYLSHLKREQQKNGRVG